MANPVVVNSSSGINSLAGTSHSATMPLSITAGNRLVLIFFTEGVSGTVSTPTGWTHVDSRFGESTYGGAYPGLHLFHKVASASEPSASITTNDSVRSGYTVIEIEDAGAPVVFGGLSDKDFSDAMYSGTSITRGDTLLVGYAAWNNPSDLPFLAGGDLDYEDLNEHRQHSDAPGGWGHSTVGKEVDGSATHNVAYQELDRDGYWRAFNFYCDYVASAVELDATGIKIPVSLGEPTPAAISDLDAIGLKIPVSLGEPTPAAVYDLSATGIKIPVCTGDPSLSVTSDLAADGVLLPVAVGGSSVTASTSLTADDVTIAARLGQPSATTEDELTADSATIPVRVGSPTAATGDELVASSLVICVKLGQPSSGTTDELTADSATIPVSLGVSSPSTKADLSADGVTIQIGLGNPATGNETSLSADSIKLPLSLPTGLAASSSSLSADGISFGGSIGDPASGTGATNLAADGISFGTSTDGSASAGTPPINLTADGIRFGSSTDNSVQPQTFVQPSSFFWCCCDCDEPEVSCSISDDYYAGRTLNYTVANATKAWIIEQRGGQFPGEPVRIDLDPANGSSSIPAPLANHYTVHAENECGVASTTCLGCPTFPICTLTATIDEYDVVRVYWSGCRSTNPGFPNHFQDPHKIVAVYLNGYLVGTDADEQLYNGIPCVKGVTEYAKGPGVPEKWTLLVVNDCGQQMECEIYPHCCWRTTDMTVHVSGLDDVYERTTTFVHAPVDLFGTGDMIVETLTYKMRIEGLAGYNGSYTIPIDSVAFEEVNTGTCFFPYLHMLDHKVKVTTETISTYDGTYLNQDGCSVSGGFHRESWIEGTAALHFWQVGPSVGLFGGGHVEWPMLTFFPEQGENRRRPYPDGPLCEDTCDIFGTPVGADGWCSDGLQDYTGLDLETAVATRRFRPDEQEPTECHEEHNYVMGVRLVDILPNKYEFSPAYNNCWTKEDECKTDDRSYGVFTQVTSCGTDTPEPVPPWVVPPGVPDDQYWCDWGYFDINIEYNA